MKDLWIFLSRGIVGIMALLFPVLVSVAFSEKKEIYSRIRSLELNQVSNKINVEHLYKNQNEIKAKLNGIESFQKKILSALK